jgi:hypothetical protein
MRERKKNDIIFNKIFFYKIKWVYKNFVFEKKLNNKNIFDKKKN